MTEQSGRPWNNLTFRTDWNHVKIEIAKNLEIS